MKHLQTWDVYAYDVWGNEDEGYTVNDRFYIGKVYTPISPSDKDVLRALVDIRYLTEDATLKHLQIEGNDDTLFIEEKGSGYPLCELVLH